MSTKKVYSTLIVDDNSADREWCQIIMKKAERFEHVYDASTGQQALDLFIKYEDSKVQFGDTFPPTLILLDINMPGMNGFEFLDKLKLMNDKIQEKGHLPLVVMMVTSSSDPEERARANGYGFVKDFITKPLTVESAIKIADTFGADKISV